MVYKKDSDIDFYCELGITKEATSAEIKKAYKTRISQEHPDKGGSQEAAAKVNLAYDILSDENKRLRYDRGESVSTAPVNRKAELDQKLVNLFTSVVGNEISEIDYVDIFTKIKQSLNRESEAHKQTINGYKKTKEVNEKLLVKIKYKDMNNSIIHIALVTNINTIISSIAQLEQVIDDNTELVNVLEDYKYEVIHKPNNSFNTAWTNTGIDNHFKYFFKQ